MQAASMSKSTPAVEIGAPGQVVSPLPFDMEIGLLTGCQDRPYAFGLAMALISKGVAVDVIGSDSVDSPEFHTTPGLKFLNMWGDQQQRASFSKRLTRMLVYYSRLLRYAATTKATIFHILWNNKIEYFDRVPLMLYYKMLGRKVTLTAHNVNQARRDANDSFLNRLTLRIQYRLADHIFVHTQKMKDELLQDFGVRDRAVTIIRHPVNNAFPDTDLTPDEAKKQLGIRNGEKTILFFGRIRPYKGLEYLLDAFQRVAAGRDDYRLIIAGEPKKGSENYQEQIEQQIQRTGVSASVIQKFQFIPDEDAELYLKAADVLVLPYKEIFQSGVLFLSLSFGLPVIAADVGSFREEIIEGKTGFLCTPGDTADLAKTIRTFFDSKLYMELGERRPQIREYARTEYSWDAVSELTKNAYAGLLGRNSS
jgi:D-inositol-3-phosphate glycosyltransferase